MARSRRCSTSPIRCRFAATIDRPTIRSKPSGPRDSTRDRPRCSRLLIADSTAGCARRASRNSSSPSRFRSAFVSRPFFGNAFSSSSSSSPFRFPGLWNPLSKLHAFNCGYVSCVSFTKEHATSTSSSVHSTCQCSTNCWWLSTTATGTPSSTVLPSLPFEHQRVYSSKIENTFSSCGIVSPCSTRRSIWSICRRACPSKRSTSARTACVPGFAASRGSVCSARFTSSRATRKYSFTRRLPFLPRRCRAERTRLNSFRTLPSQCLLCRQPDTSSFSQVTPSSRSRQRSASHSRLTSVG